MAPDLAEPASAVGVAAWVAAANAQADLFFAVREASEVHRAAHGCDLYPSADGPMLGVVAAAVNAVRIVEVGCGLGYSALWLAHGGGPGCSVTTIEADPVHADLARHHVGEAKMSSRISVAVGRSAVVLAGLDPPFDLAFFDGDIDGSLADLAQVERLVRPRGLLISSNLFLGQYVPGAPYLAEGAAYRRRILDPTRWLTVFLAGGKALSVRKE
jgi:predicted O-methyltransferase YrrM